MAERRLSADPLWGKACLGYSVQARFDKESIERLAELQDRIAALPKLPRLHWTPPATMHVSLFSIVPVRWPDAGKSAVWRQLREKVRSEVASAKWPDRLAITFHELAVTETALVLFTRAQAAPIRQLRARLNAVAVAGGQPAQTFDRTHVTLARPSHDALVDAARIAEIERTPAAVDVGISAIITVKELTYPSLDLEVLD